MNKNEFILQLRRGLASLPRSEINERITFYSEMIDDRMEEGLSEEEAVNDAGALNVIIAQILSDSQAKGRTKPKRRIGVRGIILLILGSPIWLSIIIAVFAVLLALWVSMWSVIITLLCVFVSLVLSSLGGIISGVMFICTGRGIAGCVLIGASLVLAGLSVFVFFVCKAASRLAVFLTKKMIMLIKRCFLVKE